MLKVDYLKNEKSFRSEIKSIFIVSQVLSFRHTKQTSKNVADTTFKLGSQNFMLPQILNTNFINGKSKIGYP